MNASCSSGEMTGLIRYRPPRIALACLAAATGLHVLSPRDTVLFLPYHLLGMLLLAAGFTIMMWAWVLFKKAKSAVCPTTEATLLIQEGPYRITRNPMYLGMALMLCGTAFLLGSVIAFSAPIAFIITMNEVFIPFEEADMKRLFGDSFMDYRTRVRRWL